MNVDAAFMSLTDDGAGKTSFSFDPNAASYLIVEAIAQGASGLFIDSGSRLGREVPLPRSIARHLDTVDQNRRHETRARTLIGPVAEKLGFDAQWLGVIDDPLAGPQRRIFEISPERRRTWSDLLLAFTSTHHLLIGIGGEHQIDVNLRLLSTAIRRLRQSAPTGAAGVSLAFLESMVQSYRPHLVPSLEPLLARTDPAWVSEFERFIEDEHYRQYSELRDEMRIRTRVSETVRRAWHLTRRVVAKKQFRDLVKLGVRTVAVSQGVPADPGDLDSYFNNGRALPPIVNTSRLLVAAQENWISDSQYKSAILFQFPDFDWLNRYTAVARIRSEVKFDRSWFESLFTLSFALDFENRDHQLTFEYYFAQNLTPAPVCAIHQEQITFDSVGIDWTTQDAVSLRINGCCDSAIRVTCAQMLAWNPDRQYNSPN